MQVLTATDREAKAAVDTQSNSFDLGKTRHSIRFVAEAAAEVNPVEIPSALPSSRRGSAVSAVAESTSVEPKGSRTIDCQRLKNSSF